MKKHFRGITTLLLVSLLLLGNIGYASALNYTEITEQTELRYSNLVISSADITVNASTGRVECTATAKSRVSTDTLKVTMTLQKRSGYTWKDVKPWTDSGTARVAMSEIWYITQSGSYRVITNTDVYDSAGNYVESGSATSKVVSYS